MKKLLFTVFIAVFSLQIFAQVGINTTSPSPASVLDVESSNDGTNFGGFLPPRVDATGKANITSKATATDDGLMIFFLDTRCLQMWNGVDSVWEDVYCMPVNNAPVASNVTITATSFDVGQMLTGNYTYSDTEGDPEGTSTFQWYRADDSAGTLNVIPIGGATTQNYTLTTADIGKYISFAVIPIATAGTTTGTEAFSVYEGPIDANDAPIASSVSIIGCTAVAEILNASYTYSDDENDPEGVSTYQWYTATDASGTGSSPIIGATASSYTIQPTDLNQFISVAVTPVATTGTSPGVAVFSSYEGPVLAFGGCSPILLGIQDFEVTPATPTLTLTENTAGTYQTGTGGFPNSNKFISPSRGYGVTNSFADIDLGPVDASSYTSATAYINIASFAATSGNGADGGDYVDIYVSTDGGATFSYEVEITGNNNAKWDFDSTGDVTIAYDGDNTATSFASPGGGNRTDAPSYIEITGLPNSANLVIGIVLNNNSGNETWVIDDIEVYGIN
ncbi:hypothetical protein [Patiriisocius hiemis]|uniref:AIR9-like A9 domain-containing protein n=1 Tax=Patiriisocius hiemis TaxID=3075604 RepID=A0ABU2Y9E6_9FLAO|nr:hypothetical protein [Constantimarinum sp. W242]MDT0554806.1 hypothetical protein [Constantimarinum sp. W242]